ncbi:MAG: efflux RND transporter periplasmic adaptor subunit [Acidobacteriota bacterium]
MKKWLWIVVVLLVAGAGWYLWSRSHKDQGPKYRTEEARLGDITMNVTATGTISAVKTVQVGSQVSGIVSKLYVDFNSKVTAGELLAELDPTPFEATVAQRQADVTQAQVQQRNAKIQFDRAARLLNESLIPQSDYDTAKATLDSSQAQVDQAKAGLLQANTNLTYTKIRSPIDGVVVARQYDIGQTVAASFQAPTLFTIAQDLTKMQVAADVDQSDIGRVQVDQPATFTVDAYPDEKFRGRIQEVRLNATANQNVVTYPVILEVPNPEGKLRPLMTADVSIQVAQAKDVLRVPNAALRFRPMVTGDGPSAAGATPTRAGSGGSGGTRGSGSGVGPGSSGGSGAPGESGARLGRGADKANQTVFVLSPQGKLSPVKIHIGVSDGRYTQVLDGELREGDAVVLGAATTKADAAGGRLIGAGGRF